MEPDIIKQEIREILERMGYGEEIEAIEAHQGATSRFSVHLRGEANMLIGERGGNLAALEYILKKIIQKKYGAVLNQNASSAESFSASLKREIHGKGPKFTLDINDYRLKNLENLKQIVKNAAKEVRLYKKEVPLFPMSAFERRIVHLLLAEYPDITTESIGREPERRVVIKPYP
jgi:spoIIIJ-associated protein